MMTKVQEITWGDAVSVIPSAPPKFRPSDSGSVCGIYALDSADKARKYGGNLGAVMYLVEFPDGDAIEIPDEYLVRLPELGC